MISLLHHQHAEQVALMHDRRAEKGVKPALSWNPIWINFQHLYLLARDAYHTQKWQDKLRIWFMPTGWRPKDVSILFPIVSREINTRKKYKPTYNFNWKAIAVIHFAAITIMLIISKKSKQQGLLATYNLRPFRRAHRGFHWCRDGDSSKSMVDA